MYHCPRRNKGILDRQFVTQSIVFRKDMAYPRVLDKCICAVFPDEVQDGCDYYVSNGRGMPIYTGEHIRVDNEDGVEELIPWTLETYIKLSNIKYPSKARFYCVKRFTGGILWLHALTFQRKVKLKGMFVFITEQERAESPREDLTSQVDLLTVDPEECLVANESEPLLSEGLTSPVNLLTVNHECLTASESEPLLSEDPKEPLTVGQEIEEGKEEHTIVSTHSD